MVTNTLDAFPIAVNFFCVPALYNTLMRKNVD